MKDLLARDRTKISECIVGWILVAVLLVTSRPSLSRGGEEEKVPRHAFTVERNVVYDIASNEELKADIYLPTKKTEGLRPGVLMIHGGAWMSGSKFNVAAHAMKLARNGYVVMAINYRLAPKHKFPAQLQDCMTALKWFGEHANKYKTNTERLATYGYSAGGHLACLLGLKSAQAPVQLGDSREIKLRAIVAGGAPCEFRLIPEESKTLAYWLGGTRKSLPDQYRDASPTTFVSKNAPPVFFFHGDQDKIVPLRSPEALRTRLEQKQTLVEMKVVKDHDHIMTFFHGPSMDAAREFLDTHLKQVSTGQAPARIAPAEQDEAIKLPQVQ